MISRSELARRASNLNVQLSHVLRDYVLNHVLCSIGEHFGELTFRGGTALARIYWPDFRLSEDLDFIAEQGIDGFENRLREATRAAGARAGIDLNLNFTINRDGWSRSMVDSEFGNLQLDVNFGERAYLPAEEKLINAPYSDLGSLKFQIPTLALGEILGNKWFMLDDRDEPRDLFDLWSATSRFAVPFEEIAVGHLAKYGYLPDERNLRTAQKLPKLWEHRLAHQVFPPPDFESVLAELKTAFEEWRTSSDTTI